MRIAVTGSRGLLGRPLCEQLRSDGMEVVEIDHRGPESPDTGVAVDIRDPVRLTKALRNVDGVVHLAAVSRCAPAEADPATAREVNVEGTRNVLAALRGARPNAWMVFAGSREVYGEVDRVPVAETHPPSPRSVYGQTKLGAERVIGDSVAVDPRPVTVLRFANVYGGTNDHPQRVIPSFLARAMRGDPLEVRGSGQVLDFVDVRDAVAALRRVGDRAPHRDARLAVYNIGTGVGTTLGELARTVVEITRSTSGVMSVDPEAWTPSRYVADIGKARAELAWSPTISLRDGLTSLHDAYRRDGSPA
jgi:nucleoside-diphosphate-sugar epimerase